MTEPLLNKLKAQVILAVEIHTSTACLSPLITYLSPVHLLPAYFRLPVNPAFLPTCTLMSPPMQHVLPDKISRRSIACAGIPISRCGIVFLGPHLPEGPHRFRRSSLQGSCLHAIWRLRPVQGRQRPLCKGVCGKVHFNSLEGHVFVSLIISVSLICYS